MNMFGKALGIAMVGVLFLPIALLVLATVGTVFVAVGIALTVTLSAVLAAICNPKGWSMAKITINGRTYEGDWFSFRNRGLTIDGVPQYEAFMGCIEVKVLEGVIGHLECDGSVTCGDVRGDIDAGGSVSAANVGGDVDAGGSVTCEAVRGDIEAGGSVVVSR